MLDSAMFKYKFFGFLHMTSESVGYPKSFKNQSEYFKYLQLKIVASNDPLLLIEINDLFPATINFLLFE
jgi:hypothetical protein